VFDGFFYTLFYELITHRDGFHQGKYEEQKYFGDLDVDGNVVTQGIKSDGLMM
jgi:hypothetical protein